MIEGVLKDGGKEPQSPDLLIYLLKFLHPFQDAIDTVFERWIAQFYYGVQIFLTTRYIDLSDPIENMKQNMENANDLNHHARHYGKTMIEDLINWQTQMPRYETKGMSLSLIK
ncbi:hypothetical protein ABES25_12715 [Bacillus gobiensis]|uniref:hypothetical protein n=1 Tax=Bacillus gobiensis TaxID=1441095 RepID=UPI003D1D668D